MSLTPLPRPALPALPALGQAALAWLAGWWQVLHLGAVLMVLALSPALWRQIGRASCRERVSPYV